MSGFDEKYKKKASAADAPGVAVAEKPAMDVLKDAAKEEYKAFNSVAEAQFDLWIRTCAANEDTDTSIPYSRRNVMTTDGNGFLIYMQFDGPILSVRLHGRNLGDLHRKLLKHEVEWVMEFDPRQWDALPENAPCITGIEIKRKPLPESDAAATEKKAMGSLATH